MSETFILHKVLLQQFYTCCHRHESLSAESRVRLSDKSKQTAYKTLLRTDKTLCRYIVSKESDYNSLRTAAIRQWDVCQLL